MPDLVLNDYTYTDSGHRSAIGSHHDSGQSDHDASRPIGRAYGDPNDFRGSPDRDLATLTVIIERLLSPACDGLPATEALRTHYTTRLTAIRSELAQRRGAPASECDKASATAS